MQSFDCTGRQPGWQPANTLEQLSFILLDMKLIIMQGQLATGKTTLGKKLAADLRIPLFIRDESKERLYDTLPNLPSVRQWFKVEKLSWQELYDRVEGSIKNDKSLIIEGNFAGRQRKILRKLLASNVSVVEIYCQANGKVLTERFRQRSRSAGRHKGHRDSWWTLVLWTAVIAAKLGWRYPPKLRLSSRTLIVDTSDFSKVRYDEIKAYIEKSTVVA